MCARPSSIVRPACLAVRIRRSSPEAILPPRIVLLGFANDEATTTEPQAPFALEVVKLVSSGMGIAVTTTAIPFRWLRASKTVALGLPAHFIFKFKDPSMSQAGKTRGTCRMHVFGFRDAIAATTSYIIYYHGSCATKTNFRSRRLQRTWKECP